MFEVGSEMGIGIGIGVSWDLEDFGGEGVCLLDWVGWGLGGEEDYF